MSIYDGPVHKLVSWSFIIHVVFTLGDKQSDSLSVHDGTKGNEL